MKKLWSLSFLLALCSTRLQAQECRFFPAECPVAGATDYGSAGDSVDRLANPVLPIEIAMENRLRTLATGLVRRIAAKEGWDYVLLSEEASSGARDPNEQVLAYSLRAPHWILFHFELVVDPDSLRAWKNWLMEYSQRGLDGVKAYSQQQAGVQDQQQAFMDSANYYGQQKATGLQHDPAAEKAAGDRESERKLQRIHFQDASVLVVEIGYNIEFVKVPDGLTAPAVSSEPMWMNNPGPDPASVDLFNRSHNCAVLLKGQWRQSGSEGFIPAFRTIKTENDKQTVKKSKCDQVQTVSYQLSGNARAIRRWLADMPPQN